MIRLNDVEIVNGLGYRLIKRSDKVAIYSVQGGRRYEVSRIYILPKVSFMNYMYREREAVSNNSQFGRDGSKFFSQKEQALLYFNKLNKDLDGNLEGSIPEYIEEKPRDFITQGSEEDLRANSNETSIGNTEQFISLPDTFKKNGILYRIIVRNDNVVMYTLLDGATKIGYEVCPVHITHEQTKFGKKYPSRESLPSNYEFGLEGSKAFFPYEYQRAHNYYHELTSRLQIKNKD
jgi:hypothetical protein